MEAKLIIESAGSASLGRCYSSMSYKVTSDKPLSMGDLLSLQRLGFLGYGQEFFAKRILSDTEDGGGYGWTQVPEIFDTDEQCENPRFLTTAGLNATPPTFKVKNRYGIDAGRWVYTCESRVDSSD